MVIKPALRHNSKYYVWELTDINIPDKVFDLIENGEFINYNEALGDDHLKHPATRYHLESDPQPNSIIGEILKPVIPFTILSQDYHMDSTWPLFFRKQVAKRIPEFGGSIVKDTPGFTMDPHLDNNLVFATALINLKDNPDCHTEYYSDENGENIIYTGPTKKGTGTFHYNSPYLFHNGFNKGLENRLIAFANMGTANIHG